MKKKTKTVSRSEKPDYSDPDVVGEHDSTMQVIIQPSGAITLRFELEFNGSGPPLRLTRALREALAPLIQREKKKQLRASKKKRVKS